MSDSNRIGRLQIIFFDVRLNQGPAEIASDESDESDVKKIGECRALPGAELCVGPRPGLASTFFG